MTLGSVQQKAKILLIPHQSWTLTENVISLIQGLQLLPPVRIIAEEVRKICENMGVQVLIEIIYSVNFSVVSGGAALVAGSLVAGSGTLTPALALIFGNYIIPLNAILIFSIYNCRLWRDPIRRKYVGTEHVSRYCCCSSHKVISFKAPTLFTGPVYCRTARGQCCTIVVRRGFAQCPVTCPNPV